MSPNTVYVITGANRGIGLGLAQTYLARPSTTVVGVVRNEAAAAALRDATTDTPKGTNSTLHTMQVDLAAAGTPDSIRQNFITSTGGVEHINTLILATGIVTSMVNTLEITADHLRENYEINTIGPLLMFQALWPLLEKSAATTGAPPKSIFISSSMGSIGGMEPMSGGAYGPSKAALNHIARSLHLQMAASGLVSVALHPGWVKTAMGEFVAKEWGYAPGPPHTLEDSVRDVVKTVDEATRENASGKFLIHSGGEMPW